MLARAGPPGYEGEPPLGQRSGAGCRPATSASPTSRHASLQCATVASIPGCVGGAPGSTRLTETALQPTPTHRPGYAAHRPNRRAAPASATRSVKAVEVYHRLPVETVRMSRPAPWPSLAAAREVSRVDPQPGAGDADLVSPPRQPVAPADPATRWPQPRAPAGHSSRPAQTVINDRHDIQALLDRRAHRVQVGHAGWLLTPPTRPDNPDVEARRESGGRSQRTMLCPRPLAGEVRASPRPIKSALCRGGHIASG